MPSISLRHLRNTRQLKAWLNAGETVELRERNRVLGRIVPDRSTATVQPAEWPDFVARLKRNFGNRVLPVVEDLIEERNSRY
ncbi:MAG: hypothetical protein ACRD3N_05115 [Terracidiphilus sp.]